jgi:inward rectifier potassium channel
MRLRIKQRIKKKLHPSRTFVRIAKQEDGRFVIQGMGAWYRYWRDPYHLMLTVPWWGFVSIISTSYIALNLWFAVLYRLGGDCITGARPGSFEDAFFFSVQTLGSIGYGVMSPGTAYAHFIVTLEAISSLFAIAVVTGLAFARFSKPTARVLFSQNMVIMPHEGIPTLMFRMANERENQILEAQLQVYLLQNEVTAEGEFFYRIHTLTLLRDRSPSFFLSWTAMHPITPNSPLYGATPETIIENNVQIIVSMSGIDETVAYTVNVRHVYGAGNILFNHRFVNVIQPSDDGDRYFDKTYFHHVEALEPALIPSQSSIHSQ